MIRPALASDATALAAIYNHYVLETVITFEEQAVTAREMKRRLAEVAAAGLPWVVAEERRRLVGYAYAGKWKGRCAYRYTAECTVYVEPASVGRGWGKRLYRALFAELRRRGIRAVIGGIALPNAASVALHESFGMRRVGVFPKVGFKLGRWIDVGYWQVLLPGPRRRQNSSASPRAT